MVAQIIPVIMCGGAGTRLWPVSRESMPKQFVPLVGQESTFQQVLARVTDPELFARPIVITKADFRFVVAEQLRDMASRPISCSSRCGATPVRRSRSPRCSRPSATAMPWCWCSQPITSFATPNNSANACRTAAVGRGRGADRNLRYRAHPPVTSYGYIRPGGSSTAHPCVLLRPSSRSQMPPTAATYVADGYLWNSGNFLFHAATMLSEIERFEPAMAEAAKAAVAGLTRDLDFSGSPLSRSRGRQ